MARLKRYAVSLDFVTKTGNSVFLNHHEQTVVAEGAISALYKAKKALQNLPGFVRIEDVEIHRVG